MSISRIPLTKRVKKVYNKIQRTVCSENGII